MRVAWLVISLAALLVALPILTNNMDKITDPMMGWDAAAKSEYDYQLQLNQKFIDLARQRELNSYLMKVRLAEQARTPLCEIDNTCKP